jgi:hypothetical protein
VDVGFMSGGQMDKTQYKNDFNTETGQAMHKGNEVLINFSQWFEVKGEQKEDLVRKVDKSAMGIRPSSSLVKKNSGSRALLNSSFRH